jgi:hypothetical protein
MSNSPKVQAPEMARESPADGCRGHTRAPSVHGVLHWTSRYHCTTSGTGNARAYTGTASTGRLWLMRPWCPDTNTHTKGPGPRARPCPAHPQPRPGPAPLPAPSPSTRDHSRMAATWFLALSTASRYCAPAAPGQWACEVGRGVRGGQGAARGSTGTEGRGEPLQPFVVRLRSSAPISRHVPPGFCSASQFGCV